MKILNLIILILSAHYINAQTPADDQHWELIKHFDFKTMTHSDLINEWNIAPCGRSEDFGLGLHAKQCYLGGNVSISSDGLKLQAKEDTITIKTLCYLHDTILKSDGIQNRRKFNYTSGKIISRDSMKFGYIEARIKMPYGHDFFPAFWIFRSGDYVGANEIDIFEVQQWENYPNSPSIIETNVHLGEANDSLNCPNDPDCDDHRKNSHKINGVFTDYHTYAIEWSPVKIIWYVDGHSIRTMVNHRVTGQARTRINNAISPFEPATPSQTNYPANMMIDYVKWYKLDQDCNTVINTCNFNFITHNNKVKRHITIGNGSACSNTVPSGGLISLRAQQFIHISGDFYVPLGSELHMSAGDCY